VNESNACLVLCPGERPVRVQDLTEIWIVVDDRLCGLVARVPGYRSRGPGSIPGATRFSERVWNWVYSTW
jgi:hypothetical protein